MSADLGKVINFTLIPCIAMIIGCLLALKFEFSAKFTSGAQHFAAGIVLAALATELVPEISGPRAKAKGVNFWSVLIGFSIGVALMLAIRWYFPEDEEEEEESAEPSAEATPKPSWFQVGKKVGSLKKRHGLFKCKGAGETIAEHAAHAAPSESTPLMGDTEKGADSESGPADEPVKDAEDESGKFPIGMIAAVGIDVSIDGMLVGMSFAASDHGDSAGVIMAMALGCELLFLGVSTILELKEANVSTNKSIAICFLFPCLIMGWGVLGNTVVGHLKTSNFQVFVAVLAFGIAACLWLVAEELLNEAHEKTEDSWIVTASFFVGFMVVLAFGQFGG